MLYADFVTPYAFDLIAKQAALKKKVCLRNDKVQSSEGTSVVSEASCLWNMLHLPCRQILLFREVKQLNSFDKNLVALRWTLDFTASSYKRSSPSSNATLVISPCITKTVQSKLSSHQKYRRALKICQELANLMSEVGMEEYASRMDELNRIKENWVGNVVDST